MTRSADLPHASRHILIGPLPPPVHGYAMAMAGLARLVEQGGARPLILNLAASGSRASPAYHLRRLRLAITACIALVQERRLRGDPVRVHIGCDGGAGLLYAFALLGAARLAGCNTVFHHHSHARLARRSPLLAFLLACSGQNALHVVLRPPMRDAFLQRYGGNRPVIALSNAAFVAPPQIDLHGSAGRNSGHRMTIGMIGNLNDAKGLRHFLELADAVRLKHPDVTCLLAGPVVQTKDRQGVERRVATGAVEWIGPVYGAARDAFYNRIDLLAFPSRYAHEAEPLVVLEAMANGVPVLAIDQGGANDLVGDAGVIVPAQGDFVAAALALIKAIAADAAWLPLHRANARQRFRQERTHALTTAAQLLSLPALALLQGAFSDQPGSVDRSECAQNKEILDREPWSIPQSDLISKGFRAAESRHV